MNFTHLTESELVGEVFLAAAIICINGRDLSWNADLPMLDFARSLYIESMELSPLNAETYVRTLDYDARLYLSLRDDALVEVSASYTVATSNCALCELTCESARFGIRVYNEFILAHPAARTSEMLNEWYPLEAMKQTLNAFGSV